MIAQIIRECVRVRVLLAACVRARGRACMRARRRVDERVRVLGACVWTGGHTIGRVRAGGRARASVRAGGLRAGGRLSVRVCRWPETYFSHVPDS